MELIILTEIQPHDRPLLDRLLLSVPTNLFYHSPVFHDLLKKHLNSESVYFIWKDKDNWIAYLPFIFKSDSKYGTIFNSLPYYGSNGSFVFHPELSAGQRDIIRTESLSAFEEFARQRNGLICNIITNPFHEDDSKWFRKNWKYDYTDFRIGQITTLPEHSGQTEDALIAIFSDPRPRNIRRAIKANIQVEAYYDQQSLDFLYEVHKENIESIGGKPKKKEFFDLIPQYFKPGEFCVYIATKEAKPVAALLLFYFNKTIEYFTPATVNEFRNEQPSALLIFDAMKEGVKNGFHYWNWGGTWKTQQGVYDFKKKWGAMDLEYHYYTRILDSRIMDYNIKELSAAFPNFYIYPY